MHVDLVEHRVGEVTGPQKSSELEQRGRIQHRLGRKIDAHEVAKGLAVIQRVLSASSARPYHCCRQCMRDMLGTSTGWRPTRPLGGVRRLDHGDQAGPRYDAFHLG